MCVCVCECGREGVLVVVCTFTSSGVWRKKLNFVISLSLFFLFSSWRFSKLFSELKCRVGHEVLSLLVNRRFGGNVCSDCEHSGSV